MNITIEIVGVYRVEANASVHLIEILIKNSKASFDLAEITQRIPNESKQLWQVPWDEKILDQAGEKIITDDFLAIKKPELWIGDVRMAFFFHNLDFSKPLITPFGPVNLPIESVKPLRLSGIDYERPD